MATKKTKIRKLGKNQRSLLWGMCDDGKGQWSQGCGWAWDGPDTTIRLLKGLEKRGYVEKKGDTYYVTEAGRSASAKRFEKTKAEDKAPDERDLWRNPQSPDELAKAQGVEPFTEDRLEALRNHVPDDGWSEAFDEMLARKSRIQEETPSTADELLVKVHERLGKLGVEIKTFGGCGEIHISWKRAYHSGTNKEEWSDERFTISKSLVSALQEILDHEDEADRKDAEEADFDDK